MHPYVTSIVADQHRRDLERSARESRATAAARRSESRTVGHAVARVRSAIAAIRSMPETSEPVLPRLSGYPLART